MATLAAARSKEWVAMRKGFMGRYPLPFLG
ncbi:unnamed protein product [Linum tenue]|uniref:Uncharacterized protein n=1 Tax=Linum tenue TaxID=586396 RepID=A0AAV0QPX3_9ROSI|nr:unnamed protein product [Linum tenue]